MNETHTLICSAFLSGKIMKDIAKSHGITRQRVDQVLKIYNISSRHGGIHKRAVVREEARSLKRIKKNNEISDIYGITSLRLQRYRMIFSDLDGIESPIRAYAQQKGTADRRGIEWLFDFEQWWGVWRSSGKWPLRGRTLGRYVMARIGDEGPYSRENTKIVTSSENVLEGYEFRREKRKNRRSHE